MNFRKSLGRISGASHGQTSVNSLRNFKWVPETIRGEIPKGLVGDNPGLISGKICTYQEEFMSESQYEFPHGFLVSWTTKNKNHARICGAIHVEISWYVPSP